MYNSHYCIEYRVLLYVSRAYCYLLGHDTMRSGWQVSWFQSNTLLHMQGRRWFSQSGVFFQKTIVWLFTILAYTVHRKDILFYIKEGAHKQFGFF